MGRSEGVFVPTTRYRGFDVGKAARLHVGMRPMARARERSLYENSCTRTNPHCESAHPVCAHLDVSPRDRRLCVSPGWQMNVNVNESAHPKQHLSIRDSPYR